MLLQRLRKIHARIRLSLSLFLTFQMVVHICCQSKSWTYALLFTIIFSCFPTLGWHNIVRKRILTLDMISRMILSLNEILILASETDQSGENVKRNVDTTERLSVKIFIEIWPTKFTGKMQHLSLSLYHFCRRLCISLSFDILLVYQIPLSDDKITLSAS